MYPSTGHLRFRALLRDGGRSSKFGKLRYPCVVEKVNQDGRSADSFCRLVLYVCAINFIIFSYSVKFEDGSVDKAVCATFFA